MAELLQVFGLCPGSLDEQSFDILPTPAGEFHLFIDCRLVSVAWIDSAVQRTGADRHIFLPRSGELEGRQEDQHPQRFGLQLPFASY